MIRDGMAVAAEEASGLPGVCSSTLWEGEVWAPKAGREGATDRTNLLVVNGVGLPLW